MTLPSPVWTGLSVSLVAVLSLFHVFAAVAAADARPNILFCLADDWSWPHARVYGDRTVRTPTFDRVAHEGVLFNFTFSSAPSCTPSRAAILTGQYPHRLEAGGNLWGHLPDKFKVYPDMLEASGYVVGMTRKGWGPGNFRAGGWKRNPAGPRFPSFEAFLKTVPAGRPFCFWFGSTDPHRPYEKGSGARIGLKTEHVVVPPYWPDNAASRNDVLDYYWKVERFDREVGEILRLLEAAGQLENTIVVMTGDNGWPFPRCKANLYDGGTRQPLAVRWPAKIKGGRVLDEFINLMDLAPTFLEAGGLKPLPEMTGHSFLGLLTGAEPPGSRNTVFIERERHANVRVGDASYPSRAVRTREFLYLRNFRPERWPAGDPQKWKAVGRFGDCDDGPTKNFILDHREEPGMSKFFKWCFDRRPAEELYELTADPYQLDNLAGQPAYAAAQQKLRAALDNWMKDTGDPRATSDDDRWDKYPYFGSEPASPRADMMADSPVKFPTNGALPAKYPPDRSSKTNEATEKDYYIFRTPERSLAQIAVIQAEMPAGHFTSPTQDWTHLQRTRRILTTGGDLRLLAMGDSIVNDTMRSGWVAKLQEVYPKANIQATVYVRGGGGCQHFKEEGRVARNVLPRKPDLVFIGGISQKDIESIREVIHQLRAGLPEVEILLATGVFGTVDPRDPDALSKAPHSGTGAYGQSLRKLAAEERCAYLDMTAPWAEYIRSAKVHPHLFYRDAVHANEYGEQILAKIMMAFWTGEKSGASRVEPTPLGGPVQPQPRLGHGA
ncbi:MAG: sulfatase-like hydrolase/transferase [Limisphaerales bacterium]